MNQHITRAVTAALTRLDGTASAAVSMLTGLTATELDNLGGFIGDESSDECYRCPTDPAGRIDPLEPEPGLCRGCLDEVSHKIETRRLDAAMGATDWDVEL